MRAATILVACWMQVRSFLFPVGSHWRTWADLVFNSTILAAEKKTDYKERGQSKVVGNKRFIMKKIWTNFLANPINIFFSPSPFQISFNCFVVVFFFNLSLASVIFSNTAWFTSICSLSQWTQLVQSSPFCWTHLWFQLWPWTQVPWGLWSASSSLCETWTCLTLDSHLQFPALGLLCRQFWKP